MARRPRYEENRPLHGTMTPQHNTSPRSSSSRTVLALTTLTLGCIILFSPSLLSLNGRANRRLMSAMENEAQVDDTVHSEAIKSGRMVQKVASAAAAVAGSAASAGGAANSAGTPNTASTVNTANRANRARSGADGRRLISTSESEAALGTTDGRRLGLGSSLHAAANNARLPSEAAASVVGYVSDRVVRLGHIAADAATAAAGAATQAVGASSGATDAVSSVRNIARERQLAEVWDSPTLYDTPTFWHVPKAGGTTVIRYYAQCKNLVEARGGKDDHRDFVQITENKEGYKFVNVDTSNPEGLKRAREIGLAQSGLADIVISQNLHEAADLFTPEYRGRFFGLFRHPIERAVSLFYYRQIAHWEPTYNPSLKKITLQDYAESHGGEKNWMVRMLVNKAGPDGGELTRQDLDIAKEVLRRKFVVGLMSEMAESLERFDRYFGWYSEDIETKECKAKLTSKGGAANTNKHKTIEEGSRAWNGLAKHNALDMELYDYVLELWEAQRNIMDMQREEESAKAAEEQAATATSTSIA